MLHDLCNIALMPRGNSGRVVVEIDVELKQQLHGALASDGSTLKEWFIANAEEFLERRNQPLLFKRTQLDSGDQPATKLQSGS